MPHCSVTACQQCHLSPSSVLSVKSSSFESATWQQLFSTAPVFAGTTADAFYTTREENMGHLFTHPSEALQELLRPVLCSFDFTHDRFSEDA